MSGLARALVRVAAALAPAAERARRREEWLADVDGAAEVEISPLSVATAAWRTAWTTRTRGAAVQPIGPLAIALRHRRPHGRAPVVLAAVLTVTLLAGLGLLLAGLA